MFWSEYTQGTHHGRERALMNAQSIPTAHKLKRIIIITGTGAGTLTGQSAGFFLLLFPLLRPPACLRYYLIYFLY